MAQEALGRAPLPDVFRVTSSMYPPYFPPTHTPASSLALLAVLVWPLSSKPLAGVEVVPTGTAGRGEFIWVALSKTAT